jgi:hypothetical protein
MWRLCYVALSYVATSEIGLSKITVNLVFSVESPVSKEAKEKEAWERRKNYDPLGTINLLLKT